MRLKNSTAILSIVFTAVSGLSFSQDWVEDDVYSVKQAIVPTDADLNDETDYATFVYNKNKQEKVIYQSNVRQEIMTYQMVNGNLFYTPIWLHLGAYQGTGYGYRYSNAFVPGFYCGVPVLYGYSNFYTGVCSGFNTYSNNYWSPSYNNYYGYNNYGYNNNYYISNSNTSSYSSSGPRKSISGNGGIVSRGTAQTKAGIQLSSRAYAPSQNTDVKTTTRTSSPQENMGARSTSVSRTTTRVIRPESTTARNSSTNSSNSGSVRNTSPNRSTTTVSGRSTVNTGSRTTQPAVRTSTPSVGRSGGSGGSAPRTGGGKTTGRP